MRNSILAALAFLALGLSGHSASAQAAPSNQVAQPKQCVHIEKLSNNATVIAKSCEKATKVCYCSTQKGTCNQNKIRCIVLVFPFSKGELYFVRTDESRLTVECSKLENHARYDITTRNLVCDVPKQVVTPAAKPRPQPKEDAWKRIVIPTRKKTAKDGPEKIYASFK